MRKHSARRMLPAVGAIALLFLAQLCYAQPETLALSSGTAGATGIASLNLVLTSPAGSEPASIQFTLTYPAANVTSISVSAGLTATSAGKTVVCALTSGAYTCLFSGLNANIISNGLVAVVSLTVAASAAIDISDPVAASPVGDSIPILASGGSVTFQATSTPTTVSVTPNSGAGLQQTFALQYADPLGATDLAAVWVWITGNFNSVSVASTCLINYATAANQLFLYNDAGTGGSSGTLGVAGTLSNSQCSINTGAATVTTSGTNLTLNLPVTFTAAYAGAKTTYMYAAGSSAGSGWQTMGSWTVPATSAPPTTVSVTPSSGGGLQQTFALQYADPLGATDLAAVWVWITGNFAPATPSNTCLVYYARVANQLFLYNDAGTSGSSATLGVAGALSNSQCSINAGAATVTASGTNLTLNLPVTFTAAYAGAKTTFMYAAGSNAGSGWQTMGSWAVPATSAPPTTVSVTPNSGAGLQQTFALQYADPLGATDLTAVWVWITGNFNSVSVANTCLVNYAGAANQLFLYNDAGTGGSSATLGVAGTLSNSQCSINAGAASVTTSGTNLTLNLPVTFTAGYAGAKNTYMYAAGSNAASGWQTMGTWTAPAGSGAPTTVSVTPNSGAGLQQTFVLQDADPLGATDLTAVWVWITGNFNSVSVANTCLAYYATVTNQLFLYNDAGTGGSSAALGAAGTLSNSQCSINVGAAIVTTSGTNLTLNLPVTFTAVYAGKKTTYMYAAGLSAASGWQTMGSWTVPATSGPPTAVSVTPSSGAGVQQVFALQYADPLGATDLTSVWVWITGNFNSVSVASTCLINYARGTNQLFLYNDAGTGGSSAGLGATVTLSNSQCSINAQAATVITTPGTVLTLYLPVTFTTATYAGAMTTYMYAAGSNAASGWQTMGSWTVP